MIKRGIYGKKKESKIKKEKSIYEYQYIINYRQMCIKTILPLITA